MKTIEELRTFLTQTFPNAHIYLFGSRARGEATAFSDIDIAIESPASIQKKLAWVRLAIEESLIPFNVDVVDLSKAPYLKKVIQQEGILWQ